MSDEDDLRSGLRTAADTLDVGPVPHRLRSTALHAAARRRRRRLLATSATAAAVVLVAALPVGIGALRTSDGAAAPGPSTEQVDPGPRVVDVLSLPTRGSLAGDPAAVAAVEQLEWDIDPGFPVTPVGPGRVVFAGDVTGQRWALVVASTGTGETAGQWFTGPADADPAALTPAASAEVLPIDAPTALTDPRTGVVLVLAAPGDRVQLSDRPEVAADGGVDPGWRDVDTVDGVAVDRFPPVVTTDGQADRFRVVRDDAALPALRPRRVAAGIAGPPLTVDRVGSGSPGGAFDLEYAGELLGDLGLAADQVQFESLWAGPVPGPAGDSTSGTVLAVRVPSGALVVALGGDRSTPGVGGEGMPLRTRQIVPAGLPDDRRVVALRGQVTWYDGEVTDDLVVVVPAGATGVTVLDADGVRLADLPVVDGAAVGVFPAGAASVQVAVPQGAVVTSPIADGPLW